MAPVNDLLKAWQKTPNEALRALILSHDEREPLEALRGLEKLKTAQVIERLAAFETRAKDPRVTRALETLVTEARWSSDAAKPMWRAIFALVSRTADPRFKQLTPAFAVRAAMHDWLANQYAKAVEDLPDAFAPTDETKWKAALADAPKKKPVAGARDEAALLDAVYAAPFDDAPRLVLADFLTEKGDPRGEFISLQCGARDEKRERALLKAHGKQWLAHFGTSLGAEVEWKRGFPAVGLARFKGRGDAERYGALPAWATFEALRWHDGGSSDEPRWTRFVGPNFRALTRATGVHVPSLVAAAPFPHLETLDAWAPDAASLAALGDVKRFPRLTTFHGQGSVMLPWLTPLKTLGAVKVLSVGDRLKLDEALPVLARFAGLDEVRLPPHFAMRRGPSGAFDHLCVTTVAGETRYWNLSADIPQGLFATLELVGDGALPPAEEQKLRAKVGGPRAKPAPREAPGDELPALSRATTLEWLDATHVVLGLPGQVAVVNVGGAKPKLARSLPAQRMVQGLAVLDDGATVLCASHSELRALDAASGAVRWELTHAYDSNPTLNVSPDGTRLSRNAGVFDLVSHTEVPPPKGAKGDRRAPDDGFWLRRKNVEPYELRLPEVRKGVPLQQSEGVVGLVFVADGVVAQHPQRGLTKWNKADGRVAATIALEAQALRASSRGRFVACATETEVVVAALPALKQVAKVAVPRDVTAVAVRDDGKKVAVIAGNTLHVVAV